MKLKMEDLKIMEEEKQREIEEAERLEQEQEDKKITRRLKRQQTNQMMYQLVEHLTNQAKIKQE